MGGDEEAFTVLFRRHYPRVLAFVARRTDEARAHDVVAETCATAWRHFGRLPAEPLPWLYRVARNSLANEERAARRQMRLAERIAGRGVAPVPDHALSVVADAGLRQALRRLSPADREALLLIGWEDLDHDAAARVMGCTVVAFKVRVHRARKRLARHLAEADDAPAPAELHRRAADGAPAHVELRRRDTGGAPAHVELRRDADGARTSVELRRPALAKGRTA